MTKLAAVKLAVISGMLLMLEETESNLDYAKVTAELSRLQEIVEASPPMKGTSQENLEELLSDIDNWFSARYDLDY